MGRVREMISVDGKQCWTLFDTGARNTYVIPTVADALITSETPRPIRTAFGASSKETTRRASLQAEIEGRPISTNAPLFAPIATMNSKQEIERSSWARTTLGIAKASL
jgi:hypothetical protein